MVYFSAESNKKAAMEKALYLLILKPSLFVVLLLRLALIPKFIPQTVSSEIALLPYWKRKIEKLDVKYRHAILKRKKVLERCLKHSQRWERCIHNCYYPMCLASSRGDWTEIGLFWVVLIKLVKLVLLHLNSVCKTKMKSCLYSHGGKKFFMSY